MTALWRYTPPGKKKRKPQGGSESPSSFLIYLHQFWLWQLFHKVARCPSCCPWPDLSSSFTKENINIFYLCHHIKFVFLSDKRKQQVQLFCLLFFPRAQKATLEKETVEVFAPLWKQQVHFQGNKQKRKSCFIWSNSDKRQSSTISSFRFAIGQAPNVAAPCRQCTGGFLRSSTCIRGTCVSNKAEVLLYPVTKP